MERPVEQVREKFWNSSRVRYQNFLLDKGYPFDVIDAVITTTFDELIDVQHRIDALRTAKRMERF